MKAIIRKTMARQQGLEPRTYCLEEFCIYHYYQEFKEILRTILYTVSF